MPGEIRARPALWRPVPRCLQSAYGTRSCAASSYSSPEFLPRLALDPGCRFFGKTKRRILEVQREGDIENIAFLATKQHSNMGEPPVPVTTARNIVRFENRPIQPSIKTEPRHKIEFAPFRKTSNHLVNTCGHQNNMQTSFQNMEFIE